MNENAREAILAAAKAAAQLHGYSGINFRSIADQVGIKNASIYYHFPSKAGLAAAVAERYWQDALRMKDMVRALWQRIAAEDVPRPHPLAPGHVSA